MARYFVTVVGSILIPVDAANEDEARDIVETYITDEDREIREMAEFDIGDCEEVDPGVYDCSTLGLSRERPFHLHDLDEDDEERVRKVGELHDELFGE